MKKFFKGAVVLLALAIIGYWGYKQLNKEASLLNKIHSDADSAVKIGIQEIKETLLLDALTSPGYYYDRMKFSDSEDTDEPESGIDLSPFNIVLYSLPNISNTVFSTFEINDSKAFEIFLAKELAKKSASVQERNDMGYRFARIEKSRIALGWNTEKLVIAISPKLSPKTFHKVFKDILTDGKTIQDGTHPLVEALVDQSDHVVFAQGEGLATMNFEDGKAVLAGSLMTRIPQRFQREINIETVQNPSLQVHFDGNFENAANKKAFIDALAEIAFFTKNNLDVADIANHTNGVVNLSIAGKTMQTDTIVTYGYNDNFEKVEQATVQEKQVPRIHMNLGQRNGGLSDYLTAQRAINENGIFEAFPLYTVYVNGTSTKTTFHTAVNDTTTRKETGTDFFGCRIDFEKLNEDLEVPMLKNYMESVKKMELFATQKEGSRIELRGTLTAADANINILSQLAMKKEFDTVQK